MDNTFIGLSLYEKIEAIPSACGVYCIRNNVNDKRYIGSTIDISSGGIKARLKSHIRQLKKGNHHNKDLQDDWYKYKASNFRLYANAYILSETRDREESLIRSQTIKTLYNKALSVAKNYVSTSKSYKVIAKKDLRFFTLYWQGYKVCNYKKRKEARAVGELLQSLSFKDAFQYISSKSELRTGYILEQSPDDKLYNLFISGLFLGTYLDYKDGVRQAEVLKNYTYKNLLIWKEQNITPINIKVESIDVLKEDEKVLTSIF